MQLEEEIDKLVNDDGGIKGLKSVPENAAQNACNSISSHEDGGNV
ncbi:MAG: hypothetical protein NVSMB38_25690 [Ktedonobacteraceae bacterium]